MIRKLSKRITILAVLITLLFVFFFTGCTQQETNVGKNTVSIESFSFKPNSLTISTGITVTWINNDNVDHTVTAEGIFDSGVLDKGETFEYTFNESGTYNYTCTIHPSMSGTIIVQ